MFAVFIYSLYLLSEEASFW